MAARPTQLCATLAAILCTIACSRTPSPAVSLVGSPAPTAVELRGLPSADLNALSRAGLSERQWQDILAVRVGEGSALPMAGSYEVDGSVVRFTPMYGFDAGRAFSISVDPRRIPNARASDG